MTTSDTVLVALDRGVLKLTLNRPDKLNALTPGSFVALRAHLDEGTTTRDFARTLRLPGGPAWFELRVDAAGRAGADEVAAAVGIDVAIAGVVDRRERRAAEIDAGIENADDHALAAEIRRVGVPQRRRADQLRADIGGERVLAVFLDQLHAGQFGDARGLVLGHAGDHAVDRVVHAPLDRQRRRLDGGQSAARRPAAHPQ